MIKNNKLKLLIASIVTILPSLYGIIFWNNLPDFFPVHWGADGNANNFAGKAFAVFAIPLIMLALFWLCILITKLDKSNSNQNKKAMGMVFWLIPVMSIFVNGIIYFSAFGNKIKVSIWISLVLGLMFMLIGNYMPKCKQNYTLGVKIKWTLENEENWNATHRFTGKVWFFGGLVIMFCAFLPETVSVMSWVIIMLPMVILPVIYSYNYHKNQIKNGPKNTENKQLPENYQKIKKISIVIVAVILVFICVIMFTGNININYTDNSFTIDSTYYSDFTVEYDLIDEYGIIEKDDFSVGFKKNGFNSAKLLLGAFKNDEFGNYTIFAFTNSEKYLMLKSNDDILIVGMDNKEISELYKTIEQKVGK